MNPIVNIFQYDSGPKIPVPTSSPYPAKQRFDYQDANDVANELTAQRQANAALTARLAALEALLLQQPAPTLLSFDAATGVAQIQLEPGQTPDQLLVRRLDLIAS